MSQLTNVCVTKVINNTDMRGVHKLRAKVRCRPGEAWLFFNKAFTMARLVDSVHGVHTYYAPKGQLFDFHAVATAVAAMRLNLHFPSASMKRAA